MRLSIHLVTWNGSKYIPFLFDSLRKQTDNDFKLIILDNASSDDTVTKIKNEIKTMPMEYELIENKENIGFAGGHAQLIEDPRFKNQDYKYFLIINQDLYLMPDCIEKLVKFLDEHSDVGAVAPRTMKWKFDKIQDTRYKIQDSFSDQIDSLGLKVFKNRRVIEIGEGEDLSNFQFPCLADRQAISNFQFVFGVSGAIVMFRKKAIDEAGFFDESFQSYKEDVDLSFRINSAGWKSAVLYDAITYHDRSGGGSKHKDDIASAINKLSQKPWVRYYSYRNHLLTLYKNEYWQNFLLDFPWIFWYELKKLAWFLLYDRNVLKGLKDLSKRLKDLKIKRLEITNKRIIKWSEIRKWWS